MMVQEVQTPITTTPENTLETIEAIGTSSRKIIIGRQTRERIYGESGVKLSFATERQNYSAGANVPDIEGTGTAYDQVGEIEYKQVLTGVRIPLEGNYSLTITSSNGYSGGLGTATVTTRIEIDNATVYSYDNSSNSTHTETVNMTLGKFAQVEIHIGVSTTVSLSSGHWTSYLTIQKI